MGIGGTVFIAEMDNPAAKRYYAKYTGPVKKKHAKAFISLVARLMMGGMGIGQADIILLIQAASTTLRSAIRSLGMEDVFFAILDDLAADTKTKYDDEWVEMLKKDWSYKP